MHYKRLQLKYVIILSEKVPLSPENYVYYAELAVSHNVL